MKAVALLLSVFTQSNQRRNLKVIGVLLGFFTVLVTVYSALFHVLMAREGQSHSWPTSFYWTLVTMTTVGFGDITFHSDAGRLFSVVVLLSGSIFLLVLLPFVFIQFVMVPWMAMRNAARAPRQLPADATGHLLLTALGPIEDELIRHADHAGVPYVVVTGSLDEALSRHDRGYRVMVGDLDDPATYRAARVERAALMATTASDVANTNITFTVREIAPSVPIVATASSDASIDILQLAGADEVLPLARMLGVAMADRTLGPLGRTHIVGRYAGLQIAQATTASPSLVGRTLADVHLRASIGLGIIGVWRRGQFEVPLPTTVLDATTELLLAGTVEQLAEYDAEFSVPGTGDDPMVIIGAGRVGRAAAAAFAAAGRPYKIIEKQRDRIVDEHYVQGDAADLHVLEAAGITRAAAVIITTHDDDVNVYLTIYCRRLRDDLHIVSRANVDRNVTTLYRAGADAVLSYASTGATAIWNRMRNDQTVIIAEGLRVFRAPVPPALAGTALADTHLRRRTGCNVVAIDIDGVVTANPDAKAPLPAGANLVLIGDDDDEARWAREFPVTGVASWARRWRSSR